MNYKSLVNILFALSNVVLAVKYDYSLSEWIILIMTLFLSASYFNKINFKNNVFRILVILYIFCSVHVVALLELTSLGFFKNTITYQEYQKLALWGNHLLFVFFLINNFISTLYREKDKLTIVEKISNRKKINIDILFKKIALCVIVLQFLSKAFGLNSDYQDAAIVLPFHLNGLLDEFRTQIFRFIFAIYVFHKYAKHEKFDRKCIVLFLIYSLLEVFVRSSKGAFVENFIPVIVVMAMMGEISKKTIKQIVLPLILALAVIYPIIEGARQDEAISLRGVFESVKNRNKIDESEKSSTFIRTFLTGVYYTKVVDIIDPDNFEFDFRQIPLMVVYGGGSGYMTRVIDQMPEDIHHSSGITGLCDALLWGGYPMCYIVLGFLTFLAVVGDKNKYLVGLPLYRFIFFYWFFYRFVGSTLSYFIEPSLFSGIVSVLIKIVITHYYYKSFFVVKRSEKVLFKTNSCIS